MNDASGVHSTLSATKDLLGYHAIANNVVLLSTMEIGSTSQTGDFELKGVLSGTGGLIVDHPLVALTLSGANTFTNVTDIAQGGLVVNGMMQSRLITAATGTSLSGTGTVQSVVMNSGSLLTTGDERFRVPGLMNFKGNLTLAAGSTNRMKIVATNSHDILQGAGTNTASLGGAILLDFINDATVAAGDQFNVLQLFQNWSNVTHVAGASVAAIGLPGGLAINAGGFLSNGFVTVVTSAAAPLALSSEYPISMTYHGPTPGTNAVADELLKYEPVEIMGGVSDGLWNDVRSAFTNKLVLKQDAWGGTVTIGLARAWPGHWLLKTGTKLSADCTEADTVLHVQDYTRLATSQTPVTRDLNNNNAYLLMYGLDADGQPDWSRAEHIKITAVDTANGTITVERAQQGSSALSFASGQAVIARHMLFWYNNPGGQWQLNFSLQCPRGGPLNLTAAEWFAREIKMAIDESGADGVEFDVARWQWGTLGNNPMDCDNNLVTDYGYIDGVQSFGLGGQVFVKELRRLLGPGKIIQMDSNDANGQQRGWQYVNGCQMESFPNANHFESFSEAFLHLRQYRDNITSLPDFSYAYVKTPTSTFENLYGPGGENLDWHFRVGFAADLLTGMPSPFTSIADANFNPGDPGTNTDATASTGDIFKWDEYFGGDLNDWKWLGIPTGAAVQVLDNLGGSNLFSQAVWTWKTETNFTAACASSNGTYSAGITALASVTNILPINSTDCFSGTGIPKNLAYGTRLEITAGFPAIETNREYTLEFEACGNDHWDYAGQSFDKVPRMIRILHPQSDTSTTVLVNSNWCFYRLSILARTNSPLFAFGMSEQVGSASLRNVRLFEGGAERWARAFTNGIVLLNMTRQPWQHEMGQAYRRLSGTQSANINNGQRVPPTVTVPSWDALFLVRTPGTNITVQAGDVLNVFPDGLLLGSDDVLSGCGTVTGTVVAAAGSLVSPGTNSASGGTLSFGNDFTLNGQTLTFDLSSSPSGANDRIAVAGSVTNNGVTLVSLHDIFGWLRAGTYTLMTYASHGGDAFALDAAYPNCTLTVGATSLTLTVGANGSIAAPYVWTGAASTNAWDIASTANWLFNSQSFVFYDGAGVLFDDTAAKFTVALNTVVSPGSFAVSATNNYFVTGTGGISGPVALLKSGSGQLTLSTTNSYSGGTTVAAGTLVGSTASLPGNITNNASLIFSQTNSGTFAGIISGTGTLTKQGAGTLTLAGTNTYTGVTILSATATIQVSGDANLGNGTNLTISQNASLKTTASMATGKNITFVGGNPSLNVGAGTTLTVIGMLGGTSTTPRKDTGTGTLTLNGGGAFASNCVFLLQTGRLNLGNRAALSGATLKFNGAVTLDNTAVGTDAFTAPAGLTGMQLTSGFTYAGSNSLDLSAASAGFVQTSNSIRTITVSTNTLTLGGILTTGTDTVGTLRVDGGLTKAGAGTLVIKGRSDYTRGTAVNAGTLRLGADGALSATGAVVLAGGTLDMGSTTQTVASLSVTANSTLSLASGARLTVSAQSADAWNGDLAVTGTLGPASVRFYPVPITRAQRLRLTYNGKPVYLADDGYLTDVLFKGTVLKAR